MSAPVLYCTVRDVYRALNARAFATRPVPVEACDISTGILRVQDHGWDADDRLVPVVTSGGSLPAPGLSAFASYSPIVVGPDFVRLAPVGGSVITSYSTAGSGWGLKLDASARIAWWIEKISGEINEKATGHRAPLVVDSATGTYPQQVIGLVARMVALAAIRSLTFDNAAYRETASTLLAQRDEDIKTLATWLVGKPIVGALDQTSAADDAPYGTSIPGPLVVWPTGAL